MCEKSYEEQAYQIFKEKNKICTLVVARRLKVNFDLASKLCLTAWKRHYLEAYEKRKDYELTVNSI